MIPGDDRMANIERWTIHPARRIKHEDGISMALGRVDPRPETDSEPFEVVRADAYLGAVEENERLLHGICDALKFLPPPTRNAGTAVLRGLLKGTDHEGHADDNWGQ